MAGYLHVAPQTIATAPSTGNNQMPQCSFTTRDARGRRIQVVANDYTGPQPYFILDRTATEASQNFALNRDYPAPAAIMGLGLEADWFPATRQLMATDGIRLITATVSWRGTTQARQQALAEPMTRQYLNLSKLGSARAHGYP
jgi:hypothetical protein